MPGAKGGKGQTGRKGQAVAGPRGDPGAPGLPGPPGSSCAQNSTICISGPKGETGQKVELGERGKVADALPLSVTNFAI